MKTYVNYRGGVISNFWIAFTFLLGLAMGLKAQNTNTPDAVPIETVETQDQNQEFIEHQEIVRFGQGFVLNKNEHAPVVVVIFGDAVINGEVDEAVVVIGGTATVNGNVHGEAVAILGNLVLGPTADIGGETVVVGGRLTADPKARMHGEQFEFALPAIPGLNCCRDWILQALLWGRPIAPRLPWMWFLAAGILVLYILLQVLFPRAVQSTVDVLVNKPMASFALGLLGFILFGPLLTLVTVTLIGAIFIPFFLCAFLGALLLGKASVHRFLGERIVGQLGLQSAPAPLLALIFGTVLVYALYVVPFLGFILFGILTTLGLGAVILASFSGLEREDRSSSSTSETSNNPAANVSTSSPPSPASPLTTSALDLLQQPRAGFWLRLGATGLDLILVAVLLAVISSPVPPVFFLAWMAYHVAMWSWKGTTIGGIILGIKCVRLDGRDLTFPVALIRSLSSWLSAIALFLGFFWAGWDRDRQSWHDKIAGTTIVRVPRSSSLVLA